MSKFAEILSDWWMEWMLDGKFFRTCWTRTRRVRVPFTDKPPVAWFVGAGKTVFLLAVGVAQVAMWVVGLVGAICGLIFYVVVIAPVHIGRAEGA